MIPVSIPQKTWRRFRKLRFLNKNKKVNKNILCEKVDSSSTIIHRKKPRKSETLAPKPTSSLSERKI